ncbi:MAG: succinate dehydrogenase cytochrome b subunit [Candidatus Omnitrophica bacterium]|nr:succinate dehydrogenase cytochrome b subunit [Candidatus Omnitrophota bacterium]MBI2173865.1 succinate dehydrogenase cytochrome b subunit [Candidatus Omnitrophota bacterium]MBI3010411.1 succinate dehydrogenase cytochrome b subunit [Candidatus Omnitrophota bacterium]
MRSVLRSSVGRKILVATTGLLLLGFILAHLAGNLLIFLGPNTLNAYAKKLRDLGLLLWVARFLLLSAAITHIVLSIQLAIENRRARPIANRRQHYLETGIAARSMVATGLLIGFYTAYHLLHFTFRITHPGISQGIDAMGRHDVYSMVVLSFQQWPITLFYIGAMALLSLHLSHGFSSSFQSLGWNDDRSLLRLKRAGEVLSLGIFLGYVSIPLAVWLKWVRV